MLFFYPIYTNLYSCDTFLSLQLLVSRHERFLTPHQFDLCPWNIRIKTVAVMFFI